MNANQGFPVERDTEARHALMKISRKDAKLTRILFFASLRLKRSGRESFQLSVNCFVTANSLSYECFWELFFLEYFTLNDFVDQGSETVILVASSIHNRVDLWLVSGCWC